MTTYVFDPQLVADPVTFKLAANASVTVYDSADANNTTPLTLTDLNGLPLANPLTSTAQGFVPAFQTSSSQVKLVGAGLTVLATSYSSLVDQATSAKTFVQGIGVAATNTGAPGSSATVTMDSNGQMTFTIPQGAEGAEGPQGIPGVNAVPADTAVAGYVNDTTPSSTRGALNSLYAPLTHASRHGNGGADPLFMHVNAKLDFGAKGDGTTDDTTALQNFITYCVTNGRHGYIPAGTYKVSATLNFSYRPGWVIWGAGAEVTKILMATNNTPILNLGSDTYSLMHDFDLSHLSLDYVNVQTGNTNAIGILISQMIDEGRISDVYFDGGYSGIKVVSGIGAPWGMSFDDLRFGQNLTGNAIDWSGAVNATPNNHFGRIFVTATKMTKTVFQLRGYNMVIDAIEIINTANGVGLLDFAAGGVCSIGAIKVENGTYNPGAGNTVTLINVQNNATLFIDQISVGGNAMYVTSGTVNVIGTGTWTYGIVKVGFIAAALTSAPTGAIYLFNGAGGEPIVVDAYTLTNITGLTDLGSTPTADSVTVTSHVNGRLSSNKGDANYTVALGDANKISYQTALTAPRTVTLPSNGALLFNGLYYEVIVDGAAPNGTNTLTIVSGSHTLATITTDKTIYGFTWGRRSATDGGLGWVRTKYETMP